MITVLIEAFVIGLAIASVVGPIGMLCIRKTIELGFIGALSVGLGAALADAAYGIIAGAGLTAVTAFLLGNTSFIQFFGGLFLLYLGFKEFKNTAVTEKIDLPKKTLINLTYTTFFLTLANPMTIVSFIGIFAGIGGKNFAFEEALWMVLGVFLGSMSWWIILGAFLTDYRRR